MAETTTEETKATPSLEELNQQADQIRAQRMADFAKEIDELEAKYKCRVTTRLIIQEGNQLVSERVILVTE